MAETTYDRSTVVIPHHTTVPQCKPTDVREPEIEQEQIDSLAAVLIQAGSVERRASPLTISCCKHVEPNCACDSIETVAESPLQALIYDPVAKEESVTTSASAETVVFDTELNGKCRLPCIEGTADEKICFGLPKIWRYEAEHLLHITRVGCECLRQYCSYLEEVNSHRECFVNGPVDNGAGSDACCSMLFTRAAQLIDATLSLTGQEAWASLAQWLREKRHCEMLHLGKYANESFLFVCDEASELQQHFRDDPGEDETLTRALVWDFLRAAKDSWMSEIEYVADQLTAILQLLENPRLGQADGPGSEEDLENSNEPDGKENVEEVNVEMAPLQTVREQHECAECAGSSASVVVKLTSKTSNHNRSRRLPFPVRTGTVFLPPRHYQLPTRSSIAKSKVKVSR